MIYEVIVDISNSNVDKVFDYYGEDFFCIGQRVLVPFGGRDIEGFIVGAKEVSSLPEEKLKTVLYPLDDYVALSAESLELARFMQAKYHLRLVDALRLLLPAQMRGGRVKEVFVRQLTLADGMTADDILSRLKSNAEVQRAVITALSERTTCNASEFNSAAVAALIKKGFIKASFVTRRRTPYKGQTAQKVMHSLTEEQQRAYDALIAQPSGKFLLFGVTGSGKTEVYLQVIERVIGRGKSAILLVPEISLTPSVLALFRSRFGDNVALLHSGLSAGERFDEWQRLKRGEALIAIGARSAIFAPVQNIGVIIIDEQHDGSYKSDSNPRYDTAEVAEFRRAFNDCQLILGSATPSLDAFYRAEQGEYKLLEMPKRINQMPLPSVEIVDMAAETRMGNREMFSTALRAELDDCLGKGNQAMLFINRRGYSSFVMCTKCGYVAKCKDCDVALTYHREDNQLKCHYCGNRYKTLTACPNCKNESLRQGRIGTEQVAAYVSKLYPDVKVLRMDSDTTTTKESHAKILGAFARREAQVLVGTQMIAKGHDFPYVTLVGILDGDQGLYASDYLSAERTYQLLTQVAGRSGRSSQVGKVVLQTYTPRHYCLQLAKEQNYLAFYKKEINLREATCFPPFCLVARLLYSGPDSAKCVALLNKHYAAIEALRSQYGDDFIFLQRMRCPLHRIERRYRYQVLMRLATDKADEILTKIYKILDVTDKEVSVFCERDPQNLN